MSRARTESSQEFDTAGSAALDFDAAGAEVKCQCTDANATPIVRSPNPSQSMIQHAIANDASDFESTSDIVIVSNRLPLNRVQHGRGKIWQASSGGLVSAVRPILQGTHSTWIGWTGETTNDVQPFVHEGVRNWPVPLSSKEVKSFYEGFSNRILWPLYHDAMRPPEYKSAWWAPYQAVNRRFAAAVASAASPGGAAWVHDYHLQLLPTILRELRPDLRIGFFLHIPFPPQELFAQLPWRREILQGILGADVIGFQTTIGAQNFMQVAQRFAGATEHDGMLRFGGRTIHVGAFPISIDFRSFQELAASPEVITRSREYRQRLGGGSRKIMLGLDRLDYTKGIDIRLQAYHEMLRARRVAPADCVLVQIAIPSREHVAEYKELRVKVERQVGEIEGEFGDIGNTPIHYLHRSVDDTDLVALYRAADVMLVTPLRDGMNLVAKEYVASRVDNTGVLVLSEFTGAARELRNALLVNPHDVSALVSRMERALRMPLREQEIRMQSMRKTVERHDVHAWADAFFQTLAGAKVG
jgi:trehalose 6-phosphate synthase